MVLFPLSPSLSLLSTTIISGCSPQKVFSWIISPSNSPRLGRHLLTCNQTVINEGGRGGGKRPPSVSEIHHYFWYPDGDTLLILVSGRRYTAIIGIRKEIHRYLWYTDRDTPRFLVSGWRYTAINHYFWYLDGDTPLRTEIPRYFWYPDRDNVLLVSRWRYTAMFGIQTEINHYFGYPDGETRLFWYQD